MNAIGLLDIFIAGAASAMAFRTWRFSASNSVKPAIDGGAPDPLGPDLDRGLRPGTPHLLQQVDQHCLPIREIAVEGGAAQAGLLHQLVHTQFPEGFDLELTAGHVENLLSSLVSPAPVGGPPGCEGVGHDSNYSPERCVTVVTPPGYR